MTPILRSAPLTREVLGVGVVEGRVPAPWDATVVVPPHTWAERDRLLFRSGEAGVFVTADSVTLDAPTAAARVEADWLLYATATRAMLTLRGRHNLHASLVVAPDGQAIALLGDSGAGKSTTTLELIRRGWALGSDDIVAIEHSDSGPIAQPMPRPVHLSDRAALALGGDLALGRQLPERSKRAYWVDSDPAPRSLKALVLLSPLAAGPCVDCVRIDGLAAVPAMALSADRYGIARLPEHRAGLLTWCTELCRRTPVWSLRRPPTGDTVAQVSDAVARIASS